ncbi:hypothetical protein [Escherichia phage vB_EcoM_EP57]|nr:hypothetical protein [Escherichia phage vB_EcoM_EP57]
MSLCSTEIRLLQHRREYLKNSSNYLNFLRIYKSES